jgi:hypothetical protein
VVRSLAFLTSDRTSWYVVLPSMMEKLRRLSSLAASLTPEQIAESYPSASREDIFAAVAYAAELARERIIELRAVGE